jgi:transposase-like protein
MPKQFPAEFRQRALRLVAEARQQEQYETGGRRPIQAVASRLGGIARR